MPIVRHQSAGILVVGEIEEPDVRVAGGCKELLIRGDLQTVHLHHTKQRQTGAVRLRGSQLITKVLSASTAQRPSRFQLRADLQLSDKSWLRDPIVPPLPMPELRSVPMASKPTEAIGQMHPPTKTKTSNWWSAYTPCDQETSPIGRHLRR